MISHVAIVQEGRDRAAPRNQLSASSNPPSRNSSRNFSAARDGWRSMKITVFWDYGRKHPQAHDVISPSCGPAAVCKSKTPADQGSAHHEAEPLRTCHCQDVQDMSRMHPSCASTGGLSHHEAGLCPPWPSRPSQPRVFADPRPIILSLWLLLIGRPIDVAINGTPGLRSFTLRPLADLGLDLYSRQR